MRHIIPISGKDSLTTAIVQKAHQPEFDYEYLYNMVGAEPPEIFDWLGQASAYLGKPIQMVGKDLEQVIYAQGILPSRNTRYCTRIAKIKSMNDYLGDSAVTLYYGLRADEPERLGLTPLKNQIVKFPLREHRIGISEVYSILHALKLTPPRFFWHSMFDMVWDLLGEHRHLLKTLPIPTFYSLFAGRTRPNCYFCFFQRQYEWLWLYETHPKLFWNAVKIENEVGASGYTWNQAFALPELLERQKEIKLKRARDIAKFVIGTGQLALFEDMPYDELSVTSCGLTCGK